MFGHVSERRTALAVLSLVTLSVTAKSRMAASCHTETELVLACMPVDSSFDA